MILARVLRWVRKPRANWKKKLYERVINRIFPVNKSGNSVSRS
jgi:hypothetical protein